MTNDRLGFLPRFADAIKELPSHDLCDADIAPLLIANVPPIQIFYAPFDWINKSARVIVCGITPGRHSMDNALMAARSALLAGNSLEQASEQGKRTGSFSNMRKPLAQMLDDLGLHKVLAISSTATLFGSDGENRHLLQTTSCVRYPVFVNGQNYTGHSPKLLKSATLLDYVENVLGAELRLLPKALVVPCGAAVDDALQHLTAKGIVEEGRCLFGFPHASGANGHRKRFFAERRDALAEKVRTWGR
jgi:hypothetical protein